MSAVESAQQAARLTDPVGHGLGMLGMIGGAILGAVAAGLLIAGGIVTGGALIAVVVAGCVAGGGLAGGQLLRGIQRAAGLSNPTTGKLANGSANVRMGSRPAARAKMDFAGGCNGLPLNHFPQSMVPIAEGSATVRINGMSAARVTSRLVCGAPIIEGKENVNIGGPTAQVLPINDTEEWLETGLMWLGGAALVGGAVLAALAGGAALLGFAAWTAGGMIGFEGLGWIGDQIGPGWRDILQGSAGLVFLGGAGRQGLRGLAVRRSIAASQAAEARASTFAQDFPPKKTVSSDGKKTVSGWSETPRGYQNVSPEEVAAYSNKIGHDLKPAGGQDQVNRGGFPGKYHASHAEKQMALASPDEPIGVSKPMCPDCQGFFSKHAVHTGKSQTVSDPEMTRIFNPDGTVQEIPRPQ
jgi:uncharacterized Zn-binding protein involved in type VI secretion